MSKVTKISFLPFSKVETDNLKNLLFTARFFVYIALAYFLNGFGTFLYDVHEVVNLYNFEQTWSVIFTNIHQTLLLKKLLWEMLFSAAILATGGVLATIVSFEYKYKSKIN
ncbi:hypothetical protein PA7559_08260 [Pseudoalteromonas distincta]